MFPAGTVLRTLPTPSAAGPVDAETPHDGS
jgi:hypothetical protein